MVPVHTDPEGSGGSGESAACARSIRSGANGKIAKTNTQRRGQNKPDAVLPFKRARPAAAKHGLLVSKQAAKGSAGETGIPGDRQAWTQVRVIRVEWIFPSGALDRHIAHSRIEHITAQGGRLLGG